MAVYPDALLAAGRRGIIIALSAASVLFACRDARGQSDFHAQFFREADQARARANGLNAGLLAPRSLERGNTAYAKAEFLFERHKPLDGIKEQVQLATQYFVLAADASRTAQTEFASALTARSDAITAEAMRLSPTLWDQAEAYLFTAAESLEDGDTPAARSDAGEAQGIYRTAELEAIKLNLLTPARELLVRAEQLNVKTTAQQTLERAYQRLELAEAMVQQNRYDITEARRLSSEAKYEAAHAIYLHEIISQMKEHTLTFEEALLLSESAIGRIASALNTPARFDGGYAPVVQHIITAVKSRDSARAGMAESLRRLRTENEMLRRRVTSLELGGGPAHGATSRGTMTPEERQRYIGAVTLAGKFFTPAEGMVVRDGETVVLRIFGLTFTRENGVVQTGSAELLSKIDHALRLFPASRLTVEGHTETGEIESLNQRNSEEDAAAVATYLRSFPAASRTIEYRGWGSSCPIADNTTAEGRLRNRRIDIIITPE
jgi:OOP family OmpA-OmpF porin